MLQSTSVFKRIRKLLGCALVAWAVVRSFVDLLASIQATEEYAKWFYEHLAKPRTNLLTFVTLVVGLGLIFYEPVQTTVAQWLDARGITGDADLLIQELNLSDITIIDGGASYEVDLAVFVRMEVASLDAVRTIKRFEIDMIAPDRTQYQAASEYEVGRYDYVHDVTSLDSWGYRSCHRVREPMTDLAASVRKPIQPNTHVARAWVRFELVRVKQGHEPQNCRIRIFAIDPAERRHEITIDDMKVIAVEAGGEYAVARRS